MQENIKWQSVRWPDGSKYEGLVKDDLCHLRGVFNYSSGDRYLGEYSENLMDGYGTYVWNNGTIYRGQWENSMMHGCGVKITKQPNGQFLAEEGEFSNDEWVGVTKACSVKQARKAAAQADTAAQMASVFQLSYEADIGEGKEPKNHKNFAQKLLTKDGDTYIDGVVGAVQGVADKLQQLFVHKKM